MSSSSVVLLQSDSSTAQSLAVSLATSFHGIYLARSIAELRDSIAKRRAQVAIVDMEAASLSDVERLAHEFPATRIICTHRLADEEMWTATLTAGASDIYPTADTRG